MPTDCPGPRLSTIPTPAWLADIKVVARIPAAAPTFPPAWESSGGASSRSASSAWRSSIPSTRCWQGRRRAAVEHRWARASCAGQAGLRRAKPIFIDKPIAASLADTMRILNWPRRTACPASRAPRSALRRNLGDAATRKSARSQVRSVRPVRSRSTTPILLVRNPRRRAAVHHHGDRLPAGHPRARGGPGRDRGALRRAAEWDVPRPRQPNRATVTVFGTKAILPGGGGTAMSADRGNRQVSSRPASRRSALERRLRSLPSWKLPTRASGGAAARCIETVVKTAQQEVARTLTAMGVPA